MDDMQASRPNVLWRFFQSVGLHYQVQLDRWTPYVTARWLSTVAIGFLYMLRIIYCQGFYIVTYALGIYHLNLFIAFLTPRIDPQLDFDSEDEDTALPSKQDDEFRPFMRRLPEFKFWYSATKGILVSSFLTLFEVFNIPVFWPILVLYFIVLFMLTMKRQIRHMIRYRYIPFTHGKPQPGKNVARATDAAPVQPAPMAQAPLIGNVIAPQVPAPVAQSRPIANKKTDQHQQ